MQDLICPLDGKPCEKDCQDRYIDQPEGGCFLTTVQELGFMLVGLGGGDIAAIYTPKGKE